MSKDELVWPFSSFGVILLVNGWIVGLRVDTGMWNPNQLRLQAREVVLGKLRLASLPLSCRRSETEQQQKLCYIKSLSGNVLNLGLSSYDANDVGQR